MNDKIDTVDMVDASEDSLGHTPVMCKEIVDLFEPVFSDESFRRRNARSTMQTQKRENTQNEFPIMLDCTLGSGGHSKALLEKFDNLKVVGIDRDSVAISLAEKNLSNYSDRLSAHKATFDQLQDVLEQNAIHEVDGVLMDLGLSSMQIDDTDRGFSYIKDSHLDMRMDQTQELDAKEVLNTYSEKDLVRIFREYGQDRYSKKIAQRIVEYRANRKIETTHQLQEIVCRSLPSFMRNNDLPSQKRIFQAVRIEVNSELSLLSSAIDSAFECLAVGGRLVVEAYQSLEDTIVKRKFASLSNSGTPLGLPIELDEYKPLAKNVTNGAMRASEEEIKVNRRATSVRLRCVEKIGVCQHV
jgi:16S rRNA (cytosine1402-N4)-methyltransferase